MTFQSLVWATDADVLAPDRTLEHGEDHWVVSSPSQPDFSWGNLLIFDQAPVPGARERWLACFAAAFPHAAHVTLAWDRVDGGVGAAREEFADFDELARMVGLIAALDELAPSSPAPGGKVGSWPATEGKSPAPSGDYLQRVA